MAKAENYGFIHKMIREAHQVGRPTRAARAPTPYYRTPCGTATRVSGTGYVLIEANAPDAEVQQQEEAGLAVKPSGVSQRDKKNAKKAQKEEAKAQEGRGGKVTHPSGSISGVRTSAPAASSTAPPTAPKKSTRRTGKDPMTTREKPSSRTNLPSTIAGSTRRMTKK